LIGHILRHKEELHPRIMEGKIEGKRGRRRSRTTIINKIFEDARLRTHREQREWPITEKSGGSIKKCCKINLRVAYLRRLNFVHFDIVSRHIE